MADDEILATAGASQPRRIFAVMVLTALGLLVIWLALAVPQGGFGWVVMLAAVGLAALFMAHRLWRATAHSLVLRESGLYDSDGTRLAAFEEIRKVDRGTFAMKPSNGFVVLLNTRTRGGWRPGLWWRMGKRVAVGGVTAGSETKPMADIMTLRLSQHDGD